MTKQEEALIVLNKYANDYLTAKEDYPAFEYAIECVKERKTGRWNEDGTCSICGTYSSLNLSKVKYCPECGAKMEGSDSDAVD